MYSAELRRHTPDLRPRTSPEYKRMEELRHDPTLGRNLSVLICIKGNDQERKSEAQLKTITERAKRGDIFFGKVGKPREPEVGKLVRFDLSEDVIPSFDKLESVPGLDTLYDAHEITFQYGVGVLVDNQHVTVLDPNSDKKVRLHSPWFRNLHTAQLLKNPQGHIDRMLVSSTGIYSYILLYITQPDPEVISFWSGFNIPGEKTKSGKNIKLNKSGTFEEYSPKGELISRQSIEDLPALGFANGDRVISLNSAKQIGEDTIITSFHKGEVATLRLNDAESYKSIIEDLKNPHSVTISDGGINSVISTSEGVWYHYTQDRPVAYDFRTFPGKLDEYGNNEWIQTATYLTPDLVSIVDINRRQLTLLDPQNDRYRNVPFDRNLSIQMVAVNTLNL